jgi:hypothetical protein
MKFNSLDRKANNKLIVDSPFKNKKLEDNKIEKIVWKSLIVKERLERALSWGKN